MKRSVEAIILIAVVALCAGVGFRADPVAGQAEESLVPPDPHPTNQFTRLNPGYRSRAGQSYESQLPEASASFRRHCKLEDGADVRVRDLLRGYIYRWLDAYIEAGGSTSDGTKQAEQWLDLQVAKAFGTKVQRPLEAWKTAADNPLAFLFRPHPSTVMDSQGPISRPEDRFGPGPQSVRPAETR